MIWTRVHDSMSGNQVPYGGTLIRVSQSTAVLFGRCTNDVWLLNLASAKQLKETSSIWTKIKGHPGTYGHATVLEPVSRSLWIVGGSKPITIAGRNKVFRPKKCSDVLIMPLNPSLKDLAIASVARNTCPRDPRLAPDQLASQLRDEIKTYRSEIGGKYFCSQEQRCSNCMPDE